MARFFRRGKTRVWFLPAIASGTKAPTVAEIAAGTELTGSINDMNGFSYQSETIDTPDLASPFTSTIGGPDTVDDSSLVIYLDSASNPLRSTLAKGTAGFIVINDYLIGAVAAGQKVDVWPCEIIGTPKQFSMGNDPALWTAMFSATAVPATDIAVLA